MRRFLGITLFCGLFLAGLAASGSAGNTVSELYSRCARCHGDNGEKKPNVLKGQSADTLLEKLNGYAAETYGGTRKAVMINMVKDLAEADRKALAAHISTF